LTGETAKRHSSILATPTTPKNDGPRAGPFSCDLRSARCPCVTSVIVEVRRGASSRKFRSSIFLSKDFTFTYQTWGSCVLSKTQGFVKTKEDFLGCASCLP